MKSGAKDKNEKHTEKSSIQLVEDSKLIQKYMKDDQH